MISQPMGVPILFVPGNAGSFRQVRSLASASSRQFYHYPNKPNEALWKNNGRNLDWFTGTFHCVHRYKVFAITH